MRHNDQLLAVKLFFVSDSPSALNRIRTLPPLGSSFRSSTIPSSSRVFFGDFLNVQIEQYLLDVFETTYTILACKLEMMLSKTPRPHQPGESTLNFPRGLHSPMHHPSPPPQPK